jgi:hypothetical protein
MAEESGSSDEDRGKMLDLFDLFDLFGRDLLRSSKRGPRRARGSSRTAAARTS